MDTITIQATQAAHPWRATVRTVLAAAVALAASWALVIEALGLDVGIPWVATSLALAGAVTRLMALPAVTGWLEKFVPWLAPAPAAAVVELVDGSVVTETLPPGAVLESTDTGRFDPADVVDSDYDVDDAEEFVDNASDDDLDARDGDGVEVDEPDEDDEDELF